MNETIIGKEKVNINDSVRSTICKNTRGGAQNPKIRSYGIDALKILSMFMVVALHLLEKSGISKTTVELSSQYNAAWFLETFVYCAVNCFALVTGYLMIEKKVRYKSIFVLWCKVFFYSVFLTIVVFTFNGDAFTIRDYVSYVVKAVFPVMLGQYWYFTAYFCLFFFMPFVNKLYETMNKKEAGILCASLIMLLSILPTLFYQDTFKTSYGFSVCWLLALYNLGGSIKKFGFFRGKKKPVYMFGYLTCVLITWLSKIFIGYVTLHLLGRTAGTMYLVQYTSPTILMASICLLVLFSKIEVRSLRLRKLLAYLSPMSFAVYLIHEHPLIREYVIPYERVFELSKLNLGMMIAIIVAIAVIIYIICTIVEIIRDGLFKIIKINTIIDKAWDLIDSCAKRILRIDVSSGTSWKDQMR